MRGHSALSYRDGFEDSLADQVRCVLFRAMSPIGPSCMHRRSRKRGHTSEATCSRFGFDLLASGRAACQRSMASEVPDLGFLRLRHHGAQVLLDHEGTGELTKVDGSWELKFDNGGYGLLEEVGQKNGLPAQKWAADLLQYRLFRSVEGDRERLFIQRPDSDTSCWRDSLEQQRRIVCASISSPAPAKLHLQAVLLTVPRYGSRVWFTLPRVLDALIGSSHDGRWFCVRCRFFKSFLLKLKLVEHHIQQSFHSLAAQAMHAGSSIAPELLSTANREYAMSPMGVLAVALKIGIDGTKLAVPGAAVGELPEKCEAFLHSLCVAFVPDGSFSMTVDLGPGAVITLHVEARALTITGRPPRLVQALVRVVGPNPLLPVALMKFASSSLRPSRCGKAWECGECARALMTALADGIEASTLEDLWDTDILSLPLLYKKGSQRPRRVCLQYKTAVCGAIAPEESLRSPSQYLAVQRIMAKSGLLTSDGGCKLATLRPKAGRTFCRDNMYAYLMSARKAFDQEIGGCLCVDATRVSCLEMLFVAFWSPGLQKAVWGPPQARSRFSEGHGTRVSSCTKKVCVTEVAHRICLRVTEVTHRAFFRVTEVTHRTGCALRKSHIRLSGVAKTRDIRKFRLPADRGRAVAQTLARSAFLQLQIWVPQPVRAGAQGGPVAAGAPGSCLVGL